MVILVHTAQSVSLPEGVLQLIARYGQMGVQLFFVVSAYTLCMSWMGREGENNKLSNFYIRRLFRIAPLYYFGLIAYFIFRILLNYFQSGDYIIPSQYTLVNVVANLVFVNGAYSPANNNVVPGGWSIGTEMLFYLVFPLLISSVKSIGNNKFVIMAIPIVAVLISSFILSLLDVFVKNNGFIYFSLVNQIPVFIVGMSLYFLHAQHPKLLSGIHIYSLVVLFGLFTWLSMYVGWVARIDKAFMVVPFISAISFVFLIEAFKKLKCGGFKFLQRMGKTSYSMYIIHFVFAHQLSSMMNKNILSDYIAPELSLFFCYLTSVLLTYGLAVITHKYIENYFIRIGKRLTDSRSNM